MKIAHLINITEINESKNASYLHIAQPMTMKSMIIAQKIAKSVVNVDLIAVKHKDEKVSVPSEFEWAPDFNKYAWEHIEILKNVIPHKPLPLLNDIIVSFYNASDAEYFIYTNLDIGLYPHFYLNVRDIIKQGYDAFCINRRDLPKEYKGVLFDESKIELIPFIDGIRHIGIDCFVFKREIIPLLDFGKVYIGYPPVGQVLKTQIEVNSKKFMWIKDERLTFHLGSDRAWRNGGSYSRENMIQAKGLYINCFNKSPYKRLKDKVKSFM